MSVPPTINWTLQLPHKNLPPTAEFLCKLLIEANAGKVERAIEEAASRCAEESEYIAELEKAEMVEELAIIRRRRAR